MKEKIKQFFRGDIDDSPETLTKYSHDASLFEVRPELVVYPKDTADVSALVVWVNENKSTYPNLSITARSAGTDMSGGAINDSIIMDFTRYMNGIISVNSYKAIVEPGLYYRDMEKETLKYNSIMPSYTASKEICAVGGMVANNAGGEKSIKYGKTEDYVTELEVVLSDGSIETVRPMTKNELETCLLKDTLYGKICRDLYLLLKRNKEELLRAKPNVSKNSAGYYLWNVWNEEKQLFDLCKLFVGSQGTIGIITKITFRLVPVETHSNVMAIFMPNIEKLGDLVEDILPYQPDSLESYDDYSMKLAVRFFFDFFKQLGFIGALKLGVEFLPELWMMIRGGVPKLILLVEISGKTDREVGAKLDEIQLVVTQYGYKTRIAKSPLEAQKYWKIRRESFNLLRKHIKGKRTAPFIDDVIVLPKHLPEFLPKLQQLIKKYNLTYTIAGHAGNGNFHIIPLMDLASPLSTTTILDLSEEVYQLVRGYQGSITAEHNDGIIRTPYLPLMYGESICKLFTEVKYLFDPLVILNPGKKVGGTKEDIRRALSQNPLNKTHNS
jgi:FAD/FMN-containing dehydrogenase